MHITHVDVCLAHDEVEAVEDVGGVEQHGHQAAQHHEHREVDRVVQHRPEAQRHQVPACGMWIGIRSIRTRRLIVSLTYEYEEPHDADNI